MTFAGRLPINATDPLMKREMHVGLRRATLCYMSDPKTLPPGEDDLLKGRWLFAMDFVLCPDLTDFLANWGKVKRKHIFTRSRKQKYWKKSPRKLTRKDALARSRALGRDYKEIVGVSNALYSAQPHWSLRDISVGSGEIIELIQEFQELVEYTTANFDWVGGPPILGKELQKHGWKHITYDSIKELVRDKACLVPAPLQADLAGTPEQLMDLIRQAENRVPSAAARLEFLFPDRNHLAFACECVMLEKIARARLDRIPTVGHLATQWATEAIRNPDSIEGKRAFHRLHLLVSRGSVLGLDSDKGRPKVQVHPTGIKQVYEMTYSLIKQIREVKQFFAKYLSGGKELESHLWIFYPWLRDVPENNILSFLERSTSDSAARLTGFMLRISPSKVQKTIYPD
jgi:hypothetical protein